MKQLLLFATALLMAVACCRNSVPTTNRVALTGIDGTKKTGDDFLPTPTAFGTKA